ncbi:hypothetical protein [Demequina sp. NBRC 110053]|uniref:hypothetical protein n=1 Tax=Demequina sp. NBRC 110053 TaxID=1570342 RepID=UPI0009FBB7E9|nr:hypothetical protein [Demequina sp. NBRC 110053]
MRGLRTLVSALCILAGVLLVVAGAVSSIVVRAVEDGDAVRALAERAMDSDAVRSQVAAQVTEQALDALADAGVALDGPLIESAIGGALESAVESEGFRDALLEEADAAHEQFAAALTDPDRESAPLVLNVDVSGAVNARIDDIPVIGDVVPDTAVPPVAVEVLSADRFDAVRAAYGPVAWLAAWGVWSGLAVLGVGALVSHRRRWFPAKALLALAVACLIVAGVITVLGPETILRLVPGAVDGAYGSLWRDALTEEAAPVIVERSLWAAAGAFVAALLAAALAAAWGRRR